MHVTFYGATREVTGSFHVLTTSKDRILFDCGMFQGKRREAAAKNRVMPIEPSLLTNMILSHAHIDHSGRIPLLTKGNFNGRIYCSRATADACQYLLRDSAHIQENDAAYLNYKSAKGILAKMKKGLGGAKVSKQEIKELSQSLKKGRHELDNEAINGLVQEYGLEQIVPLYTMEDAENALGYFEGVPYNMEFRIGEGMTCTLYEAGHILGSCVSVVHIDEGDEHKTVMYSGDVGRFDKPIIKDPNLDFAEKDKDIDLLIMESTYGDRLHEPARDMKPALARVIKETYERGGTIIIPAFAYGRTQEILYFLHELYLEGEVPRLPVYVDSPLAAKITRVFGEHPETYDEDTHDTFLQKGKNPFSFQELKFVQSVEESMELNRDQRSHIVLAGSGMCEGGRVLHHLRHKIHNEKNTILIVGYMGQNTLGRRIQELAAEHEAGGYQGPAPVVNFYNKEYPLKAKVITLGGFSAHGDKNECLRFLTESGLRIKNIAVVHGEEEQSLAFAEFLREHGFNAEVPHKGQSIAF
ncbi:MAG: exonuclease [Deltaproteobacteria bacterium]|nr:MAG: exonuclease [Deltaproteobacteria bacterium]